MIKDDKASNPLCAPAAASAAEMPGFMSADAGTWSVEPEDVAWMGDDGTSEDHIAQLLEGAGFDRQSPLELLLLVIIDANPTSSRLTREVRLEKALAALTGNGRRKRGMDEKDDYELLLQMGWQYHCEFWRVGHRPKIDPIARQIIERLPAKDPRRNQGMVDVTSAVKRLHDKFIEHKDLYIARATEQMNYRRMDTLRALTEIVERMQKLGISGDLEALTPAVFHPVK